MLAGVTPSVAFKLSARENGQNIVSKKMMHSGMMPCFDQQQQQPYPGILRSKPPKVVPDQRNQFRNDEEIVKLTSPTPVKFMDYKDSPIEERRARFQNDCRQGFCNHVFFTNSGTRFNLNFSYGGECDFGKEFGRVHLRSGHGLIFNGVCVRWAGWIDLETLEGVACIEYDEVHAAEWDAKLQGHTKMDLT